MRNALNGVQRHRLARYVEDNRDRFTCGGLTWAEAVEAAGTAIQARVTRSNLTSAAAACGVELKLLARKARKASRGTRAEVAAASRDVLEAVARWVAEIADDLGAGHPPPRLVAEWLAHRRQRGSPAPAAADQAVTTVGNGQIPFPR